MKMREALLTLSEVTAAQWGMVTTAQARQLGISRLQLSKLSEKGLFERLGHGVYRDKGLPEDKFTPIQAAWLSTNPKLTANHRLAIQPIDAVVSGPTASYLLELGDLVPEPYTFTTPSRRQTQRDEITYRTDTLHEDDVTLIHGLPVTTPERTIVDLVSSGMDLSNIAGVLLDARNIDGRRLAALLAPLAERHGYTKGDGESFLEDLRALAHIDIDSLTESLIGSPVKEKINEELMSNFDLNIAPRIKFIKELACKSIDGPQLDSISAAATEAEAAARKMVASSTEQIMESFRELLQAMNDRQI
ncbi:MAG: type IV toxin-antitoxin system AbiEi family antitoxin domain-containing protein [Propionibacteriaceae bacterium]|jgi:predicted transcriptional regulator of viral defense system|nr:type IV toxin-antitoxin system AbiEi family antitoxin domain-containing protein [Propionibacteriaceae bacterium]